MISILRFLYCCLVITLYPTLTIAHQAPLSMELSRQDYWRGLPFPPPGDLPDPGIKPTSPALQADYLLLSHPTAILIFKAEMT